MKYFMTLPASFLNTLSIESQDSLSAPGSGMTYFMASLMCVGTASSQQGCLGWMP